MEPYMWIIWLCIFVISVVVEAFSAELVSIFFTIGSLITLVISFIDGVPYWVEIIVFVVVSGASLFALRPLAKKYLNKEKRKTNVDEMIGKKGLMTKGCDELNYGEIKVNGVIWTALSVDEKTPIEAGTKVTIVSINGNKLVVKKEEE